MCSVFLYSFLIIFQGPTVQSEVSLTCDAWQASNADGYFGATAHWIEEPTPGKWELKSALIGFTRLNNAHNGERLGQALFKIVRRVGIELKVSEPMPSSYQHLTILILNCEGWPCHLRQRKQQHYHDEGIRCATEDHDGQEVRLEKEKN